MSSYPKMKECLISETEGWAVIPSSLHQNTNKFRSVPIWSIRHSNLSLDYDGPINVRNCYVSSNYDYDMTCIALRKEVPPKIVAYDLLHNPRSWSIDLGDIAGDVEMCLKEGNSLNILSDPNKGCHRIKDFAHLYDSFALHLQWTLIKVFDSVTPFSLLDMIKSDHH